MTPEQIEMLLTGVENCCVLLEYICGLLTAVVVYGVFKAGYNFINSFFGGR